MSDKRIATGRWRRDERKREAAERHEAYHALPLEVRLELAKSRRGQSHREVARIYAAIDAKFGAK